LQHHQLPQCGERDLELLTVVRAIPRDLTRRQVVIAVDDAEIPGTWLCRNGIEGTLIEGGDLAEPKKVKVPCTPWDMLRERRSIEELEELLKERLEIIKSRRRGS
jgi:RNA polymerase-binding protein